MQEIHVAKLYICDIIIYHFLQFLLLTSCRFFLHSLFVIPYALSHYQLKELSFMFLAVESKRNKKAKPCPTPRFCSLFLMLTSLFLSYPESFSQSGIPALGRFLTDQLPLFASDLCNSANKQSSALFGLDH